MTPKEKAIELIEKYRAISYDLDDTESHKEAALICVDEFLNFQNSLFITEGSLVHSYWVEVKIHIENL